LSAHWAEASWSGHRSSARTWPHISEKFSYGLTTSVILVTIIWITHSTGQLPDGILATGYGKRNILTAYGVGIAIVDLSPLILFTPTALVVLGLSQYPIERKTVLPDFCYAHPR